MTAKNKKLITALGIFTVLFFAVWAVTEIVIMPEIESHLTRVTSDLIKDIGFKMLFWFTPAFILISVFNNDAYVKRKEMFAIPKNWISFIPYFVFFIAFHVINSIIRNNGFRIKETFEPADIIIALFVGITEEIVFRGLLLNMTYNEKNEWLSIGIDAVLFLMIHFPIWIKNGIFISSFTSGSFVTIIILSVIFSITFIKSKSLIIPVLLHALWDFLCWFI